MGAITKIPGSIWSEKRRNGSVAWILEAPASPSPDGKRRRMRKTVNSRAEAERLRRELWVAAQTRSVAPVAQETLETFARWWLQNVKRGRVRDSTLGDYEYRLSHWILPRLGRRRLTDISAPDIETWMRDLRRGGAAVTTVNGARTILNQLFKYAHASGRVPTNPVALTQALRSQHGDPTAVQEPWTAAEARKALDAVQGTYVELMVALGIVHGLRRGEALGLRWADIDLEAGTLSIKRGLKQARILAEDGLVSVHLVEDATKTKASQRVLRLGSLVSEVLLRHRALQETRQAKAGSAWIDTDLVFTTSIGTPVSPTNVRRELNRLLEAAGVRVIRIHDMRHTSAVRALENGAPLAAVSQALGHSDVNMTKSIYAPNVPGYNDALVDVNSELYRPIQRELDELVADGDLGQLVS